MILHLGIARTNILLALSSWPQKLFLWTLFLDLEGTMLCSSVTSFQGVTSTVWFDRRGAQDFWRAGVMGQPDLLLWVCYRWSSCMEWLVATLSLPIILSSNWIRSLLEKKAAAVELIKTRLSSTQNDPRLWYVDESLQLARLRFCRRVIGKKSREPFIAFKEALKPRVRCLPSIVYLMICF